MPTASLSRLLFRAIHTFFCEYRFAADLRYYASGDAEDFSARQLQQRDERVSRASIRR